MAYENTGRLFKNDKKKSERAPDYTGDFVDEHGEKKQVAAWVKPGTNGRANWLSFRISDPLPRQEPEPGEDGGAF